MLEKNLQGICIDCGSAEIVDGGIAEFHLARVPYIVKKARCIAAELGIDYALPRIYEIRRLNGASVAPLRRFEVYEKLILALFLVGRICILIHNSFFPIAIIVKVCKAFEKECRYFHHRIVGV